MRALLIVAVLAGCGAESSIGSPCSLTNKCAGDEVCDFTAPDQPTCISGDGDLDADGLTNDKDFCHHAPGGAYDEDKDGFGDDCDSCPIAAPRAALDADGDKVESPCDPDPNEPGDEIVFFDGFGGGLKTTWNTSAPAAWSVANGELTVTTATAPEQIYLQHNVAAKQYIAVETAYRVDRVENSATRHVVMVVADDPRPAGVATMECGVVRADAAVADLVLVQSNTGAMSQPTVDPALNTSKLYRTGGYVAGTRVACAVIADGQEIGTVQTSITPDQMSSIALSAHAVSVRYQYVIVVGR